MIMTENTLVRIDLMRSALSSGEFATVTVGGRAVAITDGLAREKLRVALSLQRHFLRRKRNQERKKGGTGND